MRPNSDPHRSALAWLIPFVGLLGVAIVLFYALSLSALSGFLTDAEEKESRQLASGIRWEFHHPDDLVGGSAFGQFEAFGFSELGVAGRAGDQEGFLSLATGPHGIDATRFSRMQARIWVDQPARWLIFHRDRIGGGILGTAPVALRAGWQVLDLDLTALHWYSPDEEGTQQSLSWGGKRLRIADLRIHPASGAGTRFELDWVTLNSYPPALDRPRQSWSEDSKLTGIEIVALPWRGQRTEAILAIRDELQASHPGVTLALTGWPVDIPVRSSRPSWGVAGILVLVAALLARRPGPAVGVVSTLALVAGLLWTLTDPTGPISAWPVMAGMMTIGIAAAWPVTPAWGRLGNGKAWRRAMGWLVVLSVPVLAVVWLSPAGSLHDPDPRRILAYLPWAAAQQVVLLAVLWPLCRSWLPEVPARGVSALMFGLAHYPNFTLMVATTALAWLCQHLYQRSPGLLPLVVLHASLGTLYLEWATPLVFRSGMIGTLFFN